MSLWGGWGCTAQQQWVERDGVAPTGEVTDSAIEACVRVSVRLEPELEPEPERRRGASESAARDGLVPCFKTLEISCKTSRSTSTTTPPYTSRPFCTVCSSSFSSASSSSTGH